ncbi:MucR family transcriptional regulator [Methylobacterium durans]|uniref:MucR family transcriptional regulator n=1 Tax=Methylobacterium durans TaxID=2202825 RepID=A0A2U8WBP1_9HYPH|nr:MucR family transcriptional regulator [Methylobacterium durans]AWN42870.1 MucR family transcriptional regulator [Methylobacterium durans]
MSEIEESPSGNHIDLTVDVVSACLSNNHLAASDVPALISNVHATVSGLSQVAEPSEPEVKATPAQIRKSITPDALISFEDGKPYKTLKRHLTTHGLTPDGYREKWDLPRAYPMVTTSYSQARSSLAKSPGLGRQRQTSATKAAATAETVSGPAPAAEAPKSRGPRNKAAEAPAKPRSRRKAADLVLAE